MADPERPELQQDEPDEVLAEDFRPQTRGLLPRMLTFVGLVLALWIVFDMRSEVGYWLSEAQPVALGVSGSYQLDRMADSLYASIEGSPGPVSSRFDRFGRHYEIVAVRGTPVVVRRILAENAAPKPDQAPLTASGRLILDSSIPEYRDAFQILVARGEATPRDGHLWVLLDGERPRSGWTTPAVILGILALVGLNGHSLVRHFRARAQRAKQKG